MYLNICFVVSWIGIVTLGVFCWISHKQPGLLEIPLKNESDLHTAQNALLTGALIYGTIAIAISLYFLYLTMQSTRTTLARGYEDENETITLKASTKSATVTTDQDSGTIELALDED